MKPTGPRVVTVNNKPPNAGSLEGVSEMAGGGAMVEPSSGRNYWEQGWESRQHSLKIPLSMTTKMKPTWSRVAAMNGKHPRVVS